MNNNDKKSINTKKIIGLAIATSLAIITFLISCFVNVDTFFYNVILSFLLATLVFIGYTSSRIIEMGLSTCIFLFLGPILSIFIDIFRYDMFIDDVPYLLLELCHHGIYIIVILISYLVGLYFKNKSETKDLVIQILLINLGIIGLNILYNLCQVFVWSIVDEYNYFTSLSSFIWDTLKYSPIIIFFVTLILYISKLLFKKTNLNFEEDSYMYCSKCGKEILESVTFCPECGNATNPNNQQSMNYNQNSYNYVNPIIKDEPDTIANIIGCFFPVVGIIFYFLWKDKKPRSADSLGKWTLFGFIASIIIPIAIYIFFFIIALACSAAY